MTKNLTYVGGYPVVKAGGYRFEHGVPVEVPAEFADAVIAAQEREPQSEPTFVAEDVP